MEKIYLFTSTHCPKCPAAKEWVKSRGLEVILINADDSLDSMALAQSFDIITVPAFVVVKEEEWKEYTFSEFKELKNG